MKKVLFFLSLALVSLTLSACSSAQNNQAAQTEAVDQNLAAGSLATITNNNNSNIVTPESLTASSTPENSAASSSPAVTANPMRTLDNQKDLAAEYSQAVIKTSLGSLTVKFYADESPRTVNNFMNLAQSGFYNGTKFHRIIKDFMIQGGDPNSKGDNTNIYGTGGPGYQFADEFNSHKLVAGSLAMANSGPNTNGSQFFIVTTAETPWLDGHHTNFGYVSEGMDTVKKIEAAQTGARDIPVTAVTIDSIELKK